MRTGTRYLLLAALLAFIGLSSLSYYFRLDGYSHRPMGDLETFHIPLTEKLRDGVALRLDEQAYPHTMHWLVSRLPAPSHVWYLFATALHVALALSIYLGAETIAPGGNEGVAGIVALTYLLLGTALMPGLFGINILFQELAMLCAATVIICRHHPQRDWIDLGLGIAVVLTSRWGFYLFLLTLFLFREWGYNSLRKFTVPDLRQPVLASVVLFLFMYPYHLATAMNGSQYAVPSSNMLNRVLLFVDVGLGPEVGAGYRYALFAPLLALGVYRLRLRGYLSVSIRILIGVLLSLMVVYTVNPWRFLYTLMFFGIPIIGWGIVDQARALVALTHTTLRGSHAHS